jgi:hypothetical protein
MSPNTFIISAAAMAASSPSDFWPLAVHRSPAEINWNRHNQRQKRKNRRRAHAAGIKKAFH